jgi:hypothetical protein
MSLNKNFVIVQAPHLSSPRWGEGLGGGRARIGASKTLALPRIGDCPNTMNAYEIFGDRPGYKKITAACSTFFKGENLTKQGHPVRNPGVIFCNLSVIKKHCWLRS